MTIPLEKILTLTADEYAEMTRSGLVNYSPYAIHYIKESSETAHQSGSQINILMQEFASKVPESAEVVVDYRMNIVATSLMIIAYAYGTALIPNKKKRISDPDPVTGC